VNNQLTVPSKYSNNVQRASQAYSHHSSSSSSSKKERRVLQQQMALIPQACEQHWLP
jgi:hypothetical protein